MDVKLARNNKTGSAPRKKSSAGESKAAAYAIGRAGSECSSHEPAIIYGYRRANADEKKWEAVQLASHIIHRPKREGTTMKNTKFLVKVNRGGTRALEYVQRIDRTPIQTTTNRKLALIMGRFTAEDAVASIRTSRCTPELISVSVPA